MKKIVVQCSGGIDSTVLIGMAIELVGKENVYLIACDSDTVFWRDRDRIAVKRVATNFGLQMNLFECRLPQLDMLEYTLDDTYQDVGFIPGWKMLLNVASMAYAQKVGASEVWVGNMPSENEFPDEAHDFMTDLNNLYNRTYTLGENMPVVELVEPYLEAGMKKEDVIRKGLELGVNIFDTVSCGDERLAGGFNCGVCPWCTKRRAAFSRAGENDLTRYVFDERDNVNDWKAWADWRARNTRKAQGMTK
jgi:7-cyano-7-deazaguanine synthase